MLGHRYLEDHPLTLLVDIDAIRSTLGQWPSIEESKGVARKLAVVMAEAHLRDGHDVVVPQYLGRTEFITVLDEMAERCGATFVEVVLDAPAAVAVERFRARRRELLGREETHPQADVPEDAISAAIEDARARLGSLAAERRDLVSLHAGGDLEEIYAQLLEELTRRHL